MVLTYQKDADVNILFCFGLNFSKGRTAALSLSSGKRTSLCTEPAGLLGFEPDNSELWDFRGEEEPPRDEELWCPCQVTRADGDLSKETCSSVVERGEVCGEGPYMFDELSGSLSYALNDREVDSRVQDGVLLMSGIRLVRFIFVEEVPPPLPVSRNAVSETVKTTVFP
jgi:hypothetical protein